jgi:uncharacterized membrane protein
VSLAALRRATLALGLVGLAIAGYLTYVHYAGLQPFCLAGGGGCETVQSSRWASLAGVPVAVLGLAGYAAILATLALPEDPGRTAAALLALAGFGFSAYLTYLELFEIHAICQWCVASAVVMTLLAGVSVARLLRYDPLDGASAVSANRASAHSATDAPAASSR